MFKEVCASDEAGSESSRLFRNITADVADSLEECIVKLVIVSREDGLGSFCHCELARGFHALLV
jgi:hypothetical protein